MSTISTPNRLDRRGKTISTFVAFDAAAALRTMPEGEVLELVTDEYEPIERDITAWCERAGHRLVASEASPEGHRFRIEKGSEPASGGTFAMVISSAGLEELLSPLGFALGAALDGMDVHLYVQGPAVRVLTEGYRPKLSGWARPFTRFAASGLAKTGHIAAQDKMRQLRSLGATIYMCGPSMAHFKVDRADLIWDDLPMIEYLTFAGVMAGADVQLYT
jgi:TusA-related sulfurtransferase/predicted peroxiredoxin